MIEPNDILDARRKLNESLPSITMKDDAAEGGCGVVGLACEIPVAGRHLFSSLEQMRNRGNGKGGGVAMVGLDPKQFETSSEILSETYLYAIAYLDNDVRAELEESYIKNYFHVKHTYEMPTVTDWETKLSTLEVKPPDVVCYFILPKDEAINDFKKETGLSEKSYDEYASLLDEFVFRNTHKINVEFYAKDGLTKAFVLSHGRDLLILKIVGYAEDVIRYYCLDDVTAHVWIGHHRYPTRGRVTHPGGAHPFGQGIDCALVHNGDFSNYVSVKDYLAQRGMEPLFFTDTEVAALAFDLHYRVYKYPLEYLIESLAPTSELDFVMLPKEKQIVYDAIQKTHIHGSPDGPWFFIIAQSAGNIQRLIGITDTSMLRPQVFSYQRGDVGIAFCASEKQVIDAVLDSLGTEDDRFWRHCDEYWNARGGSYNDGGAFIFDLVPGEGEKKELVMKNKFGRIVDTHPDGDYEIQKTIGDSTVSFEECKSAKEMFALAVESLPHFNWGDAQALLIDAIKHAKCMSNKSTFDLLCLLLNRRYSLGQLRRSRWTNLVEDCLMSELLDHTVNKPCVDFQGYVEGGKLPLPTSKDQHIVVDARGHSIEGNNSLARVLVSLKEKGWKKYVVTHCRGHRFIGNGFGPDTSDISIDVFGSVGDYLGSGNDGMSIVMHGNAQDQVAQIHKSGELVVHGDVGQCYGYGSKGGNMYVLGNAAGRPMINSVGGPRLVVNGTALDYMAESFMAGDPLDDGGFVIINGVEFDSKGELVELETPYPGSNLFSLASGGAIYVRDPHNKLSESQLNGGEFSELTEPDWDVVQPLLVRNEELFGIPLLNLLTVNGEVMNPSSVYRKIIPVKNRALHAEEAWVGHKG